MSAGAPVVEVLDQGREAIRRAGLELDYMEARNADTLEPLKRSASEPIRLLAAARIGTTRLIDNIAV
jgi:pantoate--beta-alanine ligase